jgi:hypothetical protein
VRARAASAIAAAALLLALSAWSAAAAPSGKQPRGVVETCASQSSAEFSGAFTSPTNLVVGPLALVNAGGMPEFVPSPSGDEGFEKFMALVKPGHRVTIALSRSTRRGAGLTYGPHPAGELHLRDTHRVVTFISCSRGNASSNDGRPVTFWSGGVMARSPRCVPLLVWVDKSLTPRRVVIHLGVSSCS